MNEGNRSGSDRSYSYAGNYRDYSIQALVFSGIFSVVLLLIALVVAIISRLVLGGTHLTARHFLMFGLLIIAIFLITQLMARSLAGFRIITEDSGLTVRRGSSGRFIPYREISGIDRIRIPGWWPLRTDLKPRRETSRIMIRIKLANGSQVTFIGGLAEEDDMIERIRRSAGLGEAP